ncbi:peroxisomal ATPase PEX6-like, partial [Mantella aurantiaca]
MRADHYSPGGPLMSVRTRGPLTPRRLLLTTPCGVMTLGEAWPRSRAERAEPGLQKGAELGLQQKAELGLQQGAEPGLQQGAGLGLQQGAELGLQQGGAGLGLRQGAELGLRQGAELGLQQGAELGLQQGAELGLQQGAGLGLQQGAEPGLHQSEDRRKWGGRDGRDYGMSDLGSPVVSSFARSLSRSRLRVVAVDAESLVRAGLLQEVGGPLDRSCALWVSKKQLRDLGLYHREWVTVTAQGGRSHLALIVVAELCLGHAHKYHQLLSGRRGLPGTSLISAPLSFNLTNGKGAFSEVLVQRLCSDLCGGSRSSLSDPLYCQEMTCEGEGHLRGEGLRLCSDLCGGSRSSLSDPLYCQEMEISVVTSPLYNPQHNYQRAVIRHFSTTRAVQVGDVLCVSSFSHEDFLPSKSTIPGRCPDLYFKVCRIKGQNGGDCNVGYLADTSHTTLYQ